MKWLERFRRTPDAAHDGPRDSEATRAREKAERELARVKAETPQYAALSKSLREEIRETNHLTELFLDIHLRRR